MKTWGWNAAGVHIEIKPMLKVDIIKLYAN